VPLEKYFAPLTPGLAQYAADHLGDPAICRMTTPRAAAGVGLMRHMTTKEHRGMWVDFIDGARELYTLSFEAAEGCDAHATPVLAKAIHRARLRLQKLLMPLDGGARKNAELSNRAAVAAREMSFALRKADRTYMATRAWELFETWDEIRNALGVAPLARSDVFDFLATSRVGDRYMILPCAATGASVWAYPEAAQLHQPPVAAFMIEAELDDIPTIESLFRECLEPVLEFTECPGTWMRVQMPDPWQLYF